MEAVGGAVTNIIFTIELTKEDAYMAIVCIREKEGPRTTHGKPGYKHKNVDIF